MSAYAEASFIIVARDVQALESTTDEIMQCRKRPEQRVKIVSVDLANASIFNHCKWSIRTITAPGLAKS